jgi:hypothetical protein
MQRTKTFSTTITTGNVQGEALHVQMNADGTCSPVTNEALDFAAWDALDDDQTQALYDDVRKGGFGWTYGKGGASS